LRSEKRDECSTVAMQEARDMITTLQQQLVVIQSELASAKAAASQKVQEALMRTRDAPGEDQGMQMGAKQMTRSSVLRGGQRSGEQVGRCKELIKLLSEILRKDVLQSAASADAPTSLNTPKSTVGIMFDGKGTIESLLIGGPAHRSHKMRKGDRVSISLHLSRARSLSPCAPRCVHVCARVRVLVRFCACACACACVRARRQDPDNA